MEKRKRNIQIKFRVTEEEKQLIEQKMAQLPTRQIGAYLRKMAIDGLIIYTDTTNIKEMNKELHSIGVNINQNFFFCFTALAPEFIAVGFFSVFFRYHAFFAIDNFKIF